MYDVTETLSEAILRVIKSKENEWVDRNVICQMLGKKQLNYHDINVLNELVSEGYVSEKKIKIGTVKTKSVYRATR